MTSATPSQRAEPRFKFPFGHERGSCSPRPGPYLRHDTPAHCAGNVPAELPAVSRQTHPRGPPAPAAQAGAALPGYAGEADQPIVALALRPADSRHARADRFRPPPATFGDSGCGPTPSVASSSTAISRHARGFPSGRRRYGHRPACENDSAAIDIGSIRGFRTHSLACPTTCPTEACHPRFGVNWHPVRGPRNPRCHCSDCTA